MPSKQFGRVLRHGIHGIAARENKSNQIVVDELAEALHCSPHTIEWYKRGNLPPDPLVVVELARICIQRGYANSRWMRELLRAANFSRDEIDARERYLFQVPPMTHPIIETMLPRPLYPSFIMRRAAYLQVMAVLRNRFPVIVIEGFAGTGKTSLAREVADHCATGKDGAPHFNPVVWVSEETEPVPTTLGNVFDRIAATFAYPGWVQGDLEENRRQIHGLLCKHRVLLVIDNYETLTDDELIKWLFDLPEPSKALILSRQRHEKLQRADLVKLHGMEESEAYQLIEQRLEQLNLRTKIRDLRDMFPLIQVTGGNPKALEMAIGCLGEGKTLTEVADDIQAASGSSGQMFEALFARCCAVLDRTTRRVLLVATLFLNSVEAQALADVAGVEDEDFKHAVSKLVRLGLLDQQRSNLSCEPRYALHPLVRAIASREFHGVQARRLRISAQQQWIQWYVRLASDVGYCYGALEKLQRLDTEQETLHAVMQTAFDSHHYEAVCQIARGISYYYYVRGYWNRRIEVEQMRADAARLKEDRAEEVAALVRCMHIRSMQGEVAEVERYHLELQSRVQDKRLPKSVQARFHQAMGQYWRMKDNLAEAQAAWQASVQDLTEAETEPYVMAHHGLASILLLQGQLDEARQIFQDALAVANHHELGRAALYNQIKLAVIDLQQGQYDDVEALLKDGHQQAALYQEPGLDAQLYRLEGQLRKQQKLFLASRTAFEQAVDIFRRLGMRRHQERIEYQLRELADF